MVTVGRTSRRCVDWNKDKKGSMKQYQVAPHAGAWIEMPLSAKDCADAMSHLTQVRGLK